MALPATLAELFVTYHCTTEVQLRAWVEANPQRIEHWAENGETPLSIAIRHIESLSLVLWLLDEKGADVNGRSYDDDTPLHVVR